MSSQPSMGGHLVIPQNDILYTNVPPMSNHLRLKVTFPVSQGWLLIADSTVVKIVVRNVYSGYITIMQITL